MAVSLAQEVLGITNPADFNASVNEACMTLTGHGFDASRPEEELDRLAQTGIAENQLGVDMRAIIDILRDGDANANPLVNWPQYEGIIQRYGRRGNGNARALMVGALSAISTRSFVCLAESVYGVDPTQTYVVDLVGGAPKTRHGRFVHGDGTNLPFANGVFDFVQTDLLIHMLRSSTMQGTATPAMTDRLLGEMARVMKPGGQLIMKEIVPDLQKFVDAGQIGELVLEARDFEGFLLKALARHGIAAVSEVPRAATGNFLFDPNRQYISNSTPLEIGALCIYGIKP